MYRPLLLLTVLILSAAAIAAQDPDEERRLPPPSKSTLRARVFYEDTGRPVRRMSVILISERRNRELSGVTDANGNLEIKNLQAGKYYAVVNAPGVVSPLAYVDFRRSRAESFEEQFLGFPAIDVNGLTDVTAEIPARRGGVIGGRVTYSNGDPALGVKVEILRKVGDEYLPTIPNGSAIAAMERPASGMSQTDDRGVYRFPGLPAGEYLVKVTENVSHSSEPTSQYPDLDTVLTGSGSLVSVFFENAFSKEDAQALTVQFGQELADIDLTIPDRGLHTIEGRIVASRDKLPIRGAVLSIKREGDTETEGGIRSRGPQRIHSDESGVWRFTDLPKGSYRISAEAENAEFNPVERAYGSVPAAANMAPMNTVYRSDRKTEKQPPPKFAKVVKVFTIEDNDLSQQTVELPLGGTLIGTVLFEDPKDDPAKGNRGVSIAANDEAGMKVSTSVSFYDYSGERVGFVRSREFRLEGIGSGKNFVTIDLGAPNYYVKSAESNQIDLLKGPIEIKDGETLANIRIVLSNEMGTLKGTVIDDDKQPMPGFSLMLVPTEASKFRTSNFFRAVRTDENGEFEVKLPPLEYAVITLPPAARRLNGYEWVSDSIKQAQTFKIDAGKTTRAAIKRASTRPAP